MVDTGAAGRWHMGAGWRFISGVIPTSRLPGEILLPLRTRQTGYSPR